MCDFTTNDDRTITETVDRIRKADGLSDQEAQELRKALFEGFPDKAASLGSPRYDEQYASRYTRISDLRVCRN